MNCAPSGWNSPPAQLPSPAMIARAVMLLVLLGIFRTSAGAAEPFSFARLTAATIGVPTVRVTFTQEKHLAILDEPVIAKGLIEISRPLHAVRWERCSTVVRKPCARFLRISSFRPHEAAKHQDAISPRREFHSRRFD